MSTVEERLEYLNNPFFNEKDRIYGDYTTFYITIAICTVFLLFVFALNLICGCCSKNKSYWNDRHTGNRWLVTIFTSTAHKQPPLDLTELESVKIDYPKSYPVSHTCVHVLMRSINEHIFVCFRDLLNKLVTFTITENSKELDELLDHLSIINNLHQLNTLKYKCPHKHQINHHVLKSLLSCRRRKAQFKNGSCLFNVSICRSRCNACNWSDNVHSQVRRSFPEYSSFCLDTYN